MPTLTRPRRVTHQQAVSRSARAEGAAALGLQVVTQIGTEWRIFAELTLWQRVWWLCTGRGPHVRKSQEQYADLSTSDRP